MNRIFLYRPRRRDRTLIFSLVGVLAFLLVGCALSSQRRHPEFERRIVPLKTLFIIPADVCVYEELTDGRLFLRDDLSRAARDILDGVLSAEFTSRGFRVRNAPQSNAVKVGELEEIVRLYRAVNKSIQLHTFGPDIFPAKQDQFEYSVGSLSNWLQEQGADAIIFVRGLFRFSDRQARSHVSIGVADATGTILWYGANGERDSLSWENPDKIRHLLKSVLADFPRNRL